MVLLFIVVDHLFLSKKAGKRRPPPAIETNIKLFSFQNDKNLMQSNGGFRGKKIPNGSDFEL